MKVGDIVRFNNEKKKLIIVFFAPDLVLYGEEPDATVFCEPVTGRNRDGQYYSLKTLTKVSE